jgi:hypothetical protein
MRLRAIAALLVTTSVAHAGGPLPSRAAGFEVASGYAGTIEHIHFKQRFESGVFLRIDRWEAIATAGVMVVESGRPERDSAHLTDLSLGGRIVYLMPLGDWNATFGFGIADHWTTGNTDVTLTCHATGACIAGYYRAEPAYHAWVPQLRGGVAVDNLSGSTLRSLSLELIVERWDLSGVPGGGISGFALLGGITGTFGRGWAFPQ